MLQISEKGVRTYPGKVIEIASRVGAVMVECMQLRLMDEIIDTVLIDNQMMLHVSPLIVIAPMISIGKHRY